MCLPEITLNLVSQWKQTIQIFGIEQTEIAQSFSLLTQAYSTSDRYYHNLTHIHHVLSVIDTLQIYAQDLLSIRLAAWFHDVIYDPQRHDNEQQSAEYAAELLKNLQVPVKTIETVTDLILQTKYHQGNSIDSQILLDADLAILSAPIEEYQTYASAIRQEYAWVSDANYILGRQQVLERFLQRPQIYSTPWMLEKCEKLARSQIKMEIVNNSQQLG
jgi:predicted metal-dependent HD superfamily phosphohydrolase